MRLKSVLIVTAAFAASAASASAAMAQQPWKVMRCMQEGGGVAGRSLVEATYRFNGTSEWEQWDAAAGAWVRFCSPDNGAHCDVQPAAYTARWGSYSDPPVFDWRLDRLSGVLAVTIDTGAGSRTVAGRCTVGQEPTAPAPSF